MIQKLFESFIATIILILIFAVFIAIVIGVIHFFGMYGILAISFALLWSAVFSTWPH